MLKLHEILRASVVKRWGIVNVVRTQSIAEHSYNVCMIVRCLCKLLDKDDVEVMKAALSHDLDEVIYGDIPSPMKQRMLIDGVDLNKYMSKERPLDMEMKQLLKLADLLESIIFLQDHSIGKHAEEVQEEIATRLFKLVHCDMGEHPYYLEICDFVDRAIAGVI